MNRANTYLKQEVAATPTYLERVKADWKNRLATLPCGRFDVWLADCMKSFQKDGENKEHLVDHFEDMIENRHNDFNYAAHCVGSILNRYDRHLFEGSGCSAPIDSFGDITDKVRTIFAQGTAYQQSLLRGIIELVYVDSFLARNNEYDAHPIIKKERNSFKYLPESLPAVSISQSRRKNILKRSSISNPPKRIKFGSAVKFAEYYAPLLNPLGYEVLIVVLLDSRRRMIRDVLISTGDERSCSVDLQDFFFPMAKESAHSVVMLHNHPKSGPEPSEKDFLITGNIKRTVIHHDVELLDHIVIGKNQSYFSFNETGVLKSL